jgi:hypothetical protein
MDLTIGLRLPAVARMRMSHVYQPLLIRALVRAGGSATLRQLATALLLEDESRCSRSCGGASTNRSGCRGR